MSFSVNYTKGSMVVSALYQVMFSLITAGQVVVARFLLCKVTVSPFVVDEQICDFKPGIKPVRAVKFWTGDTVPFLPASISQASI